MHLKRQNSWPLDVIDHDALIDYTCIVYKTNNKYYEILTIYECLEKLSMIIGCNIWVICLELNWFFYDPSWMLQLSEFVWTLRSLVLVAFNNFLLIDATEK